MLSTRWRTVRGGLALAALALLGLGSTPSASAASTVTARPSAARAAEGFVGYYNVRAVHSGKCLAPEGNSTGEDVAIWQQPCDGRPSQRVGLWSYGDVGGTAHYALVTDSGKCWGKNNWAGHGSVLDIVIRTTSCGTYWKEIAYSLDEYHPWGGKQIRTYNDSDGGGALCLHVHNASTGDGAGLLTQFCNDTGSGARNDTFEFLPV
ncbi:RICIN domain-containing protein [Streptomyces tsukubensis]|uniref:RICIN domain-containing protein n=1 Tax=Streptomyces tsukubensis TaxID=83656 RepID=UPI003683257C